MIPKKPFRVANVRNMFDLRNNKFPPRRIILAYFVVTIPILLVLISMESKVYLQETTTVRAAISPVKRYSVPKLLVGATKVSDELLDPITEYGPDLRVDLRNDLQCTATLFITGPTELVMKSLDSLRSIGPQYFATCLYRGMSNLLNSKGFWDMQAWHLARQTMPLTALTAVTITTKEKHRNQHRRHSLVKILEFIAAYFLLTISAFIYFFRIVPFAYRNPNRDHQHDR